MPLTPEQKKNLEALRPRAFRLGKQLAFVAPTWCMRRHLSLAHFMPDLEHPTRGPIAMRDFANIPSAALKPFFANPAILDDHARDDTADGTPSVIWQPETATFQVHPRLIPLPGRVYSLASDLSVSGDATGLAMTHIEPNGDCVIDFSLGIKAAPRVDYRPIEDFFTSLRDDYGFTILGISFDQFQSNRTIAELEERGFDCCVVRYADTLAGCSTMSDFIHSRKLVYYAERDKEFIGEAKELQDINGRRIDHMTSGGVFNSKDVWDAVLNATIRALEDDKNAGIRLSEDDIHTTNLVELRAINAKTIQKRRSGESKEELTTFHFAFCNTRLDQENDSDVFTLVRVAKPAETEQIFVLEAIRRHCPAPEMAKTISDLLQQWKTDPFASTIDGFPCEIATFKSHSADILSDKLLEDGSDLMLSQMNNDMSDQALIETLKELTRKGVVVFPKDWNTDHEMGRTVRRLLAYPYVADAYDLVALAGAVVSVREVELVTTTSATTQPFSAVKLSGVKGI